MELEQRSIHSEWAYCYDLATFPKYHSSCLAPLDYYHQSQKSSMITVLWLECFIDWKGICDYYLTSRRNYSFYLFLISFACLLILDLKWVNHIKYVLYIKLCFECQFLIQFECLEFWRWIQDSTFTHHFAFDYSKMILFLKLMLSSQGH